VLKIVAVRACAELERLDAEHALRDSEMHYRSLFDNMLNGFAYCLMLFEQGQPQDFIFLRVNKAFETPAILILAKVVRAGLEPAPTQAI